MKKIADANLLIDRIFINSRKGTQSVAALSEPIFELSSNSPPENIGEKVRNCIESYKQGSERYTREDWKRVYDPLLKLSGEKSEKSFFSKVKHVPIMLLDGKLIFFPRNNFGWKEGFKSTEHPNIELNFDSATNLEIGKALLKALEYSKII